MTESVGDTSSTPAAANLQPLTPEALLHDGMTRFVDDAVAYYAGQPTETSERRADPYIDGRVTVTHYHRDGTNRQVTTDKDGAVRTKIHLPKAVTDSAGRRVMLVTERDPDDNTTYNMRFLPTGTRDSTIYEWSADAPVAEVLRGDIRRPVDADALSFQQAWSLTNEAGGRWRGLIERRRPDGSMRAGRTVTRLIGALASAVDRIGWKAK
jgi:hypothetical protein